MPVVLHARRYADPREPVFVGAGCPGRRSGDVFPDPDLAVTSTTYRAPPRRWFHRYQQRRVAEQLARAASRSSRIAACVRLPKWPPLTKEFALAPPCHTFIVPPARHVLTVVLSKVCRRPGSRSLLHLFPAPSYPRLPPSWGVCTTEISSRSVRVAWLCSDYRTRFDMRTTGTVSVHEINGFASYAEGARRLLVHTAPSQARVQTWSR